MLCLSGFMIENTQADYWLISYCGELTLESYEAVYVESEYEGVYFNDYC